MEPGERKYENRRRNLLLNDDVGTVAAANIRAMKDGPMVTNDQESTSFTFRAASANDNAENTASPELSIISFASSPFVP